MKTFSDFGWTPALTSANQRIAVQAAFDSGEALDMPIGTVTIDAPLIVSHPLHLVGHGGDITGNAIAASMFRTTIPNLPMIQLLPTAHDSYLSGFHLHADAAGGTGIVLGDGTTDHLRGVVLDRITSNVNLKWGVHALAMGGCELRSCSLWGSDAAVRVENLISADAGDNHIIGGQFNAGSSGSGIRWTSGGGLYITSAKFCAGYNHININWNRGGSGNFALTGCSLESCTNISVDMQGSQQFKRMQLAGNTWGGVILAVAVRNFSTLNWLRDLLIEGNTLDTSDTGSTNPIVDLGCTDNAFVTGNSFRGAPGSIGIITRNGTGAIGPNRFVGCGVSNGAGWPMSAQL